MPTSYSLLFYIYFVLQKAALCSAASFAGVLDVEILVHVLYLRLCMLTFCRNLWQDLPV